MPRRKRSWTVVQAQPHSDGCACSACIQFHSTEIVQEQVKPQKKPKEKDTIVHKPNNRRIKL